MGNPAIYWYPDPAGSLEYLDFGMPLSDLTFLPIRESRSARTAAGAHTRVNIQGRDRIRLTLERFGAIDDRSLVIKLESLRAHLARGGFVGFSRDHAKTWAGFTFDSPNRGQTGQFVDGNVFAAWSASGTVTTNDEIVFASANPERLYETVVVSSLTSDTLLALSSALVYSYATTCSVRWRWFWPIMVMPEDGFTLTHDHELNYTFELILEEDPDTLLLLEQGGALAGTADPEDNGSGQSIVEIIEERKDVINQNLGNHTPGSGR